MTHKTTLIGLGALLTTAGMAWGQPLPPPRPLSPKERALTRLIEHSARSEEPAVALLSGMTLLPDGVYSRGTIRKAIVSMDAFADMPDGTEAEVLALLDRWAAIDDTLGKTRQIEKRGDRVRIRREAPQGFPFRDGRLELAEDITFRLRSRPVDRPSNRPGLQQADPGTYVQVDQLEGVRVEGGKLDELILYSVRGNPTVSYHVRGQDLGLWRERTLRRVAEPAGPAPEVGEHQVALRYGLAVLPLRKGPSATTRSLQRLAEGTRLQVLSEEYAPWWQVRVGRSIGYVHSDHVAERTSSDVEPTQPKLGLADRLAGAAE